MYGFNWNTLTFPGNPPTIPEPGTLVFLLVGGGGVLAWRRLGRIKRSDAAAAALRGSRDGG